MIDEILTAAAFVRGLVALLAVTETSPSHVQADKHALDTVTMHSRPPPPQELRNTLDLTGNR